jgi:DNA-directed RNA polymerase subunit beta'
MIINDYDCGTKAGIWVRRADDVGGQTLAQRVVGRVLAGPVTNSKTGEIVTAGELRAERDTLINEDLAEAIDKSGVDQVYLRSVLVCQMRHGVCAMCYGRDLGRGELVEIGAAVGIVAAQSIGEPGTQLTLRTFHTGGVAGGGDITHGLPRVEELFEARKKPKGEAIMSDIDGSVEISRAEGGVRTIKVVDSQLVKDEYDVPGNWAVKVEDGADVQAGDLIAKRGEEELTAKHAGRVVIKKNKPLTIVYEVRDEREYEAPASARLLVEEGQKVKAGDQLTEGTRNPHRILRLLGREATQLYLLQEIQKVYRSQGVNINDKHFEVIIKKMLSKVQVVTSGDSELLPGELVDRLILQDINEKLHKEGKRPATAAPVLFGVTKAALNTESFLSASSFQHTIKVLAGAAIEGKLDDLRGLKENVIIGKLIPAGTGFKRESQTTQSSLPTGEATEMGIVEPSELMDD